MTQKNYNSIDNPYDSFLNRTDAGASTVVNSGQEYGGTTFTDSGNGGSASPNGSPDVSSPNDVSGGSIQGSSFQSIWLKDWIKSRNYKPKSVGFYIDGKTGYAEFVNVYVSGNIQALSGLIGGFTIGATNLSATSGGNTTIVSSGSTAFSAGPTGAPTFYVTQAGVLNATGAIISGTLTATTGYIGGWLINATNLSATGIILDSLNQQIKVGATDPIIIDGLLKEIESSNYVSGAFGAGFHLDSNLFEVGNISCRGMIRTSVFQKDLINVMGGSFVVLDGDILDTTMTALDTATITTKGTVNFSINDILRIKEDIDDEWFRVTNVSGHPTYVVTRDLAGMYPSNTNPCWTKGSTIVNYRQSGDGGVFMTATETDAPYLSIFDHAGSPWTTINTRLRLGNLNGFLGYSSDLYGIAIGETNSYLKYDTDNGLRIKGDITITGGNASVTFYESTEPVSGMKAGDYWVDSDDNSLHVYQGGVWVLVAASGVKVFSAEPTTPYHVGDLWASGVFLKICNHELLTGVYNPLDWSYATGYTDDTVANSKIKTFIQTTIPTSISAGDLWIDSDDGNKLYRATNAGDTTIGPTAWVVVPIDFANINGATKPENNATVGATWGTNLVNIPGTLGTPTGTGLFLSSTHLGFYDAPNWKTYMDSYGNFYLGGTSGKLQWVAGTNTLTITGIINADSGTIGGFTLGADYIRDSANGVGLASTVSGGDDVRFWAGDTFANRDIAPFRVYESGNVVMERITASNIQAYDAIVDINGGGDYYDLYGAVLNGAKKIFIRNGEYILTSQLDIAQENVKIEGQSRDKTIITRARGGNNIYFLLGDGTTQWDVTNPAGTTFRYTWNGQGYEPDFSKLKDGYNILIESSSGTSYLDYDNTGNFCITGTGTTYFEITNSSGVVETGKTIGLDDTSYIKIRPKAIYGYATGGGGGNLTEYTVTNPVGTTWRYTYTGVGGDPDITTRVKVGMLVDMIDSSFSTNNKGLYTVTGIGTDYFEVDKVAGTAESKYCSGIYLYSSVIGDSTSQFDITCLDSVKKIFRYTWDGTGTDPNILQLTHGENIYIKAQNFSSVNNGHFVILNPTSTTFDIHNEIGVAENNKTIGTGYIIKVNTYLGDSSTQFDITNPSTGLWRYTWDGTGKNPHIEELVSVYDTMYINGSTFASNNRGKRVYVYAVGTDYFEIKTETGTVESNKILGTGYIEHVKGYVINNWGEKTEVSNLKFIESGNYRYGCLVSLNSLSIHHTDFDTQESQSSLMPCIVDRSGSLTLKNSYLISYSNCVVRFPYSGNETVISENHFESYYGSSVYETMTSYRIGGSSSRFDITNTAGDTWRYTWDGTGTDPGISTGWSFYAVIVYAENFTGRNNGIFQITDSGLNWFEVTNINGYAENNKTIGEGYIEKMISGGFYKFVFEKNYCYRGMYNSSSSYIANIPGALNIVGDGTVIRDNTFFAQPSNYTPAVRLFGVNSIVTGNKFNSYPENYSANGGLGIHITAKGSCVIENNIFNALSIGILLDYYETDNGCGHASTSNNLFNFVVGETNGYGISILSPISKMVISGNHQYCGASLIDQQYGSSNLTVINNIVTNSAAEAFLMQSLTYSVFSNNQTKDCYLGYDISGADYCTILGNISQGNANSDDVAGITNSETAHNLFL